MFKQFLKESSASKKLFIAILAIILFLMVLHISLQALHYFVFSQNNIFIAELANRFDFNDEQSFNTWFNAALLAWLGLNALLIGNKSKTKQKSTWFVIGVLAIFMSIDEVAGFHETALQLLHISVFGWGEQSININAWLLVLPLIVALAVFIYKQYIAVLPKNIIFLIGLGGLVYLSGAILVETFISSIVFNESSFINDALLVTTEEVLELTGISIALLATFILIEENKLIS